MLAKTTTSNLGYQQITPGATSTALTIPAGARFILIQSHTNPIRWRDDGTAPSATIGMRIPVGVDFLYDGELQKFRIIEEATGAIVNISYYA